MSYEVFKFVHLLGVVLFLGNIIVTAVWKTYADRTKDPRIIAYAQRLVTVTDWMFTATGVVLILIGACGMTGVGKLDLGQRWLAWGQALFVASAVIWLARLVPIQRAQARLARGFADGGPIPDAYWRYGKSWMVWGIAATILPLATLYFMVFKP